MTDGAARHTAGARQELPPTLIDEARDFVRRKVRRLARWLNRTTHGKIHPNVITYISLVMHVPIALLIASRHNLWAALLLIVFGLFDTLDGELARLQHRDSAAGMLLDASTDRLKEVILYMGIAWAFASVNNPYMSMWAVAAVGASLLVSYIKAKGETAVAGSGLSKSEINRLFQDGFMRYEIRMVVLILGLLSGLVAIAVGFIAIVSLGTAVARLFRITRALSRPVIEEVPRQRPQYDPPEDDEPAPHHQAPPHQL